MRNVVVIGSGSAQVAAALRLLMIREALEVAPSITLSCEPLADTLAGAVLPAAEDPFQGGGRSKGDKKRAARERRMRGGF